MNEDIEQEMLNIQDVADQGGDKSIKFDVDIDKRAADSAGGEVEFYVT